MSSRYPILDNRPIDQWKVTELKEELKRRKLTTRGLKDDLVRRLDESIRNEIEKANMVSDNGFDSAPQSQSEVSSEPQPAQELLSHEPVKNVIVGDNAIEKQHTLQNEELSDDMKPPVTYDQERVDAFVSEKSHDQISHADHVSEKLEDDSIKNDINDNSAVLNEEKAGDLKVENCAEPVSLEMKQEIQGIIEETTEVMTDSTEDKTSLSGEDLQDNFTRNEIGDLKSEPKREHSESLLMDVKVDSPDPNNQVSEVSPVLGFQVKSDSISSESVTINEQNELKDNIIADDVKIELDVNPEMLYQSSSHDVPDGGKSHPMDVEEPQANKVSVEDTYADNAENEDSNKENDTVDLVSSEKLNLDRSSGDDFMEEDVMEAKQIESKPESDEVSYREKELEPSDAKEEGLVDIVGEDLPDEVKVVSVEEKNGAAAAKRKLDDHQTARSADAIKRQRRWNSEGLKVSEPQSGDAISTTPKVAAKPVLKRSFSRSDSTISEETPKERVVLPSTKPPTSSLRIDRFLRPFTLKAVQELLGRTGTVTDFWMDHIKTHCYVSYSSVDEAVETRDAVYNLQWPPNGGRLLVAEFVDPQEVKARLETPAAPASAGVSNPSAPQSVPPQPSPRPPVQKQQPPQPVSLPPPPPLPSANPPPAPRDHQPPMRERLTLPPPPPLPEKVEPPIVTLDDLFRKTKATPRIYYLPLSEEQVAAKLHAQGKTVKQ